MTPPSCLVPALSFSLPPGIFVNDIIDAVPIDKYFELFKPNAGGEGGQIRICLNFSKDLATLDPASGCGARNVGVQGAVTGAQGNVRSLLHLRELQQGPGDNRPSE